MSRVTPFDPFINKLIKSLGMPPHVSAFTLRVEIGKFAEVDVTYYPTLDAEEPITERFNLVPVDPDAPSS